MHWRILLSVVMAYAVLSPGWAADLAAGKTKALFVCSDCHGATGISVVENYPNLAGQKEMYLTIQLKAFRAGKRQSQEMNLIAKQMSDADIANVAAYYAKQLCAPEPATK